jgi:hypothetical protein
MDWSRVQDFGMQDLIFKLSYQKCALDFEWIWSFLLDEIG